MTLQNSYHPGEKLAYRLADELHKRLTENLSTFWIVVAGLHTEDISSALKVLTRFVSGNAVLVIRHNLDNYQTNHIIDLGPRSSVVGPSSCRTQKKWQPKEIATGRYLKITSLNKHLNFKLKCRKELDGIIISNLKNVYCLTGFEVQTEQSLSARPSGLGMNSLSLQPCKRNPVALGVVADRDELASLRV